MKEASFIDPINVERYESNPWSREYKTGLYFSALRDLGFQLDIPIGLKQDNELSWYKAPHALHDGYSALNALFKDRGISHQLPDFDVVPPKNRWRSFKEALRSKPSKEHHFKNQLSFSPGTDFSYETLELPLMSLRSSDFVRGIAQVCMEQLTFNKKSRWMIPVRTGKHPGLQASYFGIEIDANDSIEATRRDFKSKLICGEHWGFHYLARIGLFLGKWFIKRATVKTLNSKKSLWMGSISLMGNLGQTQEIEKLFILHPVRWHRPVGAIVYQFNSRQYITLSLHKSLQNVDLKGILNAIERKLFDSKNYAEGARKP
ncbi:MAG: hypothetical protein KDD22_03580 [Bdellovibrionales bacterium]|nr:hypothetical protein [Bdellovibrionales bacterium]